MDYTLQKKVRLLLMGESTRSLLQKRRGNGGKKSEWGKAQVEPVFEAALLMPLTTPVTKEISLDELPDGVIELQKPPTAALALRTVDRDGRPFTHPVHGKRLTTIHVEPLGADVVSLLFAGRIWPFRDRLDEYGVPGAFHKAGADKAENKYYRALRVLVTDEGERRRALEIFAKVLYNMAMKLRVVSDPQASSTAAAFVADLRAVTCMHA